MTTLLVFCHLRWGFVYQRPQHLLTRLAQTFRVIVVEEPVRAEAPARLERHRPAPGVELLVPHTPVDAPGFHDDQITLLEPLLSDHLRAEGIDDYLVWFYTPMALPLIAALTPRAVVYDCMDELAAFRHAPRQLRQRETALLKRADLVLTGGPALYESKRGANPNVQGLPSSVDAAHFAPAGLDRSSPAAAAVAQLQGGLPRPRLGFYGVIDERFDVPLLEAAARARPDWHWVMVGPVVKIDPASLPRLPNVHWIGMQPYENLPWWVDGWDVCLMPFALNESTRYISPTKTLEYLAGERPVVGTPVHDVVGLYGDVVRIADGAEAFVAACAAALAEDPPARAERLRRAAGVVRRSSWDAAAERVRGWLREVLDRSAIAGEQDTAPVRPVDLRVGEVAIVPADGADVVADVPAPVAVNARGVPR